MESSAGSALEFESRSPSLINVGFVLHVGFVVGGCSDAPSREGGFEEGFWMEAFGSSADRFHAGSADGDSDGDGAGWWDDEVVAGGSMVA